MPSKPREESGEPRGREPRLDLLDGDAVAEGRQVALEVEQELLGSQAPGPVAFAQVQDGNPLELGCLSQAGREARRVEDPRLVRVQDDHQAPPGTLRHLVHPPDQPDGQPVGVAPGEAGVGPAALLPGTGEDPAQPTVEVRLVAEPLGQLSERGQPRVPSSFRLSSRICVVLQWSQSPLLPSF